jgi:hypothetical protein
LRSVFILTTTLPPLVAPGEEINKPSAVSVQGGTNLFSPLVVWAYKSLGILWRYECRDYSPVFPIPIPWLPTAVICLSGFVVPTPNLFWLSS